MSMEEVNELSEQEEYIIEVLTGGLYHNKFHVLREYIQNSFDAINAYNRIYNNTGENLEIQVICQNPSIFIIDNGVGMNREKINQYRKIGYSEKKMDQAVGFRGIGKLSGLSVCEKLIVTSKQKGNKDKYTVLFDANAMLEEIITLKADGLNIPLNELIPKHTKITTETDEDIDKHFTIVELYNIRHDSHDLFTHQKVSEYISLNCPVRFNPVFEFADQIEENIKIHVSDYSVVPIKLNGDEIFKPYFPECKAPNYIPVWGSKREDEDPIAFCWFCANKNKGQFEDKTYSGLVYKYKNFTVGDKQLTRTTLWRATPERAFYFFGEIYINKEGVMPSSERSNFEHNDARDELFEECQVIPKQLNKLADSSSKEHRALFKLVEAESEIENMLLNVEQKKIPVEIQFEKAVKAFSIVNDLETRVDYLPANKREKASNVIEKGKTILSILKKTKQETSATKNDTNGVSLEDNSDDCTYDIKKVLSFEVQAARVYDIIVNVIKDQFIDNDKALEDILFKIHKALEENLYKE